MADVLLRPGLLAEAEIIVEKLPNTLYLPQQAIFERDGQPVVFVRAGERFEARRVKLGGRTESQVAVLEGVREGDTVSLVDIEESRTQQKKDKGPAKTKSKQGLPSPQARLEPDRKSVV